MENIVCCKCGVQFAITTALKEYRQKDHELFYCPNGHGQHYSIGTHVPRADLEKLQQENDALMHRVEILEAQLAEAKGGEKQPSLFSRFLKGKSDDTEDR